MTFPSQPTAISAKEYPNGRCCVFQPFDKGAYDKRFYQILSPAIVAAGLEPYRVDQDAGAIILMETLHKEIKGAAVCLADIGTQNPNVMYELGFAIATGQNVVLICPSTAEKFPFDIQHRQVIKYSAESPSDFAALGSAVTEKLIALVQLKEAHQQIVSLSPGRETAGLEPYEIAALAFVMAGSDAVSHPVPLWLIRADMESAGYNKLATRLALSKLVELGYLDDSVERDDFGEPYCAYKMTVVGEKWIVSNREALDLKLRI